MKLVLSTLRLRRSAGERGATLILFALLLIALFTIVALVVDLGLVRQNRQADKSAADFAVAAGIRNMDNGAGAVQSWKGICAARDYLLANSDELAGMTEVYVDGLGGQVVDGLGNPVSAPCASPPATTCDDSPSPNATWGRLTGTADGGRIRVTIQSGYDLTASSFAEDAGAYDGDDGDGPCDHLAVIIEERESAYFGGVAGASGYDTTIRSVARADRGDPEIVAALILLERNDCRALEVSGSGAYVVVSGAGPNPGAIHSDSLGNGDNCNDKIFSVNGSVPPPRITSEKALTPGVNGKVATGQISAVALTSAAGADPTKASDGVDRVCAQKDVGDCGNPSTGLGPEGRDLVGRVVADERYLQPIQNLRSRATSRFAITNSAQAIAAGYTPYLCGAAGPFEVDLVVAPLGKGVWINCPVGSKTFDGKDKVFGASLDGKEIIIRGNLTISGSGNTLRFNSPSGVYVSGASANAVSMGSNDFLVNDGGVVDGSLSPPSPGTPTVNGFVCDDRHVDDSSARTEFVVGKGRIAATGGTLRLCQTTVYLMDDSGGTGCPLPSTVTTPGLDPYANDCQGNVSAGGGAKIDWTAPNQDDVNAPEDSPIPNLLEQLEDLALWSETSGKGGSAWGVGGSGGLSLGGIFVAPNADPFTITGGGSIDILDAQFVTRKLVAAGTGYLRMAPRPQNALKVPPLSGFALVR